MKLKIYAMFDRATATYGNPMFLVSAGQVTRSLRDEVNSGDKTNQLAAHPEDFDLYYLGEYDNDDGSFETKTPEMIVRAQDLKQ